MFEKNQEIQLHIDDMSVEGAGIGHLDGMTFFVKDAVVGDEILAGITKVKKRFCFARLIKVIEPSSDRVEAKCPVARQCGGCSLQALSYEKQLDFKTNIVRNNLIRLGGFESSYIDEIMEPIIGMDNPWNYRNKAQFPVGCDRDGNIVSGFYGARSHNIIPVEECYIGQAIYDDIMAIVRKYMMDNKVDAYNEVTGVGILRHVLIRKAFATGQIMVCLVVNCHIGDLVGVSENIPGLQNLVKSLSQVDGMTSIVVNENRENTNVILGDKTKTIWGKDYITDYIGEVAFNISATSFYQVNPVQTLKLYETAMEFAGCKLASESHEGPASNGQALSGKIVWDLYCGIGTISLFLAQKASEVYGIEVVPQAIIDARANAKLNGMDNAKFFVGQAEDLLPKMVKGHGGDGTLPNPDIVVVDPPRKGCDEVCLETIVKAGPERIVYVSCDSATLARDLKILTDSGYELKRVRPVDQFCHTTHVETVSLLSRAEGNKREA